MKKEVKYKQRCENKRKAFTEQITGIDVNELVYIDETGIDNNLHSFTQALGFRTMRSTLIAGYCYGSKDLIAPMQYDGYTNTEVFLAWVEHGLCKELKPNQYVIMDNASFHKSAKVRELIEAVSCKLIYLPPYSPDMNPIEHVWANLKRLIRAHPDKEQDLDKAIKESLGILFIS